MEKMPHPESMATSGIIPRGTPGRTLLRQASGELFQPLTATWNVGPHFRRIVQFENALSGCHNTAGRDLNVTSL
jgi:hypothetical protein